jgi:hypothetical protein
VADKLDLIPDTDADGQTRQQLDSAQTFAQQRSPDDAADTFSYAKATGFDFPTAEKIKKTQPIVQPENSWASLIKDHPVLSQALSEPAFAASASDDVKPLSMLERLFGGWDQIYSASKLALEDDHRNQELSAIGRAQRYGTATPTQLKRAEELEAQASKPRPNVGFFPGIVPAVVGGLPGIKRALPVAGSYALAGGGGGALVGAAAGGVGAVPGAAIGFTTMGGAGFSVGMAEDTAKTEQGLAYREYIKLGADPKVAAVAADLVALANGGLQLIPAEKVLNIVPGLGGMLAGKNTRDIMRRLITSNTGRAALARFAGRVAESGLIMALVGGAQELIRENGRYMVGATPGAKDVPYEEGNIVHAMEGGGQQGLGFGVIHSYPHYKADMQEVRLGEARGEMYKSIAQISTDSKLRERMPEEFKAYANAVIAEHGKVEEAKAPAEALTNLFQKEGITEEQLAAQMPEVARQLKTAKPNQEIVIPMGDLATHLAPLKSFTELQQDLRVGDELTPREAKKVLAEAEKRAAAEPEAPKEGEQDKVYNDVYEKLTNAGQAPEVAQHDAVLWSAFAKARAERLGVDPFEYYKQRDVRIGAEMPGGEYELGQREPRLIAQHNLTEENLLHADELGALPVPSIGIANKDHPLSGFGEITLLAKPNLIDPKSGVPVMGADIYSTRHPRARYKVNEKPLRALIKELAPSKEATGGYISDLYNEVNEKGVEAALNERGVRKVFEHAFLLDQGEKVAQKTREVPLYQSDIAKTKVMREFFKEHGINQAFDYEGQYHKDLSAAVREAIKEVAQKLPEEDRQDYIDLHEDIYGLKEHGIINFNKADKFAKDATNLGKTENDPYAMEDLVSKKVDEIGRYKFEKWAKAKIKDAVGEPYISKHSEMTGNEIKRAYSVDNIVREMTRKLARGEGNMYGFGWARAEGTPRYRSLDAIQKADKKIVSHEEFQKLKDKMDAEGVDIGTRLGEHYDREKYGGFGTLDGFVEALAESYRRGKSLRTELEASGFKDVPEGLLREAQDFANRLREMPTEYFEAKPQRAVGLHEFTAAVVPKKIKAETRAVLEKHGLKIYEYDAKEGEYPTGKKTKWRNDVIAEAAQQENVLFQDTFSDLSKLLAKREMLLKEPETADTRAQLADINEQMKAAAMKAPFWDDVSGELKQKAGEGYRGKISFDQARSYFNITLTGKANLSTFLHESGHAFLEFLRMDAMQGHEQSKADFEKIRGWMGAKPGEELSTDQLEQFAKGFETYLSEGRAPAAGLREAFRSFAAWLKLVYRSISGLGVHLNDDVRGVMDRMLASDSEIEQARKALGFEPMKKPDAMSAADYTKYTERFARAVQQSRDDLEGQAIREFKKTIGEEREKVRSEVEAAIKLDPVQNAYEALRTGKRLDGGEVAEEVRGKKISREAVREFPGYKDTPRWTAITSPDGLDPETLAPYYGFNSGEEMLTALAAKRSFLSDVREETERRMREKYPDAEMGKMADQAIKSFHNDDVANVLWTEAQATAKYMKGLEAQTLGERQMTDPRFAKAVVKETARRRVEMMTGVELQPGRFARGEESAAAESAKAFKAGDFEKAHEEKLNQIMQHELWRQVSSAREEVDSIRDYLAKFNELPTRRRIGKAGQMYTDAIDKIISDIELKKQSNKALERRASLASYLEQMEADGDVITMPSELRSEAALKNYKQMTVEEMRTVRDAVKNIESMARLKNFLFDGREKRDFQTTAVKLGGHISANVGDSYAEKPNAPQNPGRWEKLKSAFRESRAEKKMMEFVARELDGGQIAGFVHELLFQPLKTAEARKHELTEKITEQLLKPLRELTLKERFALDKTVDFLGTPMKMRDVIAVALNMGNEGNKRKLIEGYHYRGWTEEAITNRLGEVLTDKHLDLVQHFWKTIGQLWPEIKELSERTTGVSPPKVEASKLLIRGRELEGGYYPIVYDRERSYKAEQIAQRKEDLFENNFLKPGVSKGFTETRTKFAAPLLLSLNVIPAHVNEVVHYLTHYEPVRAIDRLVAHSEVRKAITEGLSREMYNEFRPWLQRVAHAGALGLEHMTMIDRGLRALRVGNTLNRFGFKITSSLMQGLNILSSAKEVGIKNIALGTKRWMEDIESFRDPFGPVYEKSADLRGKAENVSRELIGGFDHFTSAFSEFGHFKEQLGHFSMCFFTHVIRTVDTITWYAAREKAFAEEHPRPEEYADSVVRMSQMGESVADKARIMFGGEGAKLFTGMYSWYSVVYNQLYEKTPRNLSTPQKIAEHAARWWWMVIAPSVAMTIIKGRTPKKDQDEASSWVHMFAEDIAVEGMKPFPIAGLVGESMLTESEPRFGTWLSTMVRGVRARAKMVRGETLTAHEKADLVKSTGILARFPADAMWNAYKYISAVHDGKLQEPIRDLLFRSPGEWK